MTYRRTPGSLHDAVSQAVRALGREVLSRAAGVSPSRLDQLMNPMRRDLAVVDHMIAIDAAAARGGHGTPIFDAYHRRLAAGLPGSLPSRARLSLGMPLPEHHRRVALEGTVRMFLVACRRALEGLESALAPDAGLRGAA